MHANNTKTRAAPALIVLFCTWKSCLVTLLCAFLPSLFFKLVSSIIFISVGVIVACFCAIVDGIIASDFIVSITFICHKLKQVSSQTGFNHTCWDPNVRSRNVWVQCRPTNLSELLCDMKSWQTFRIPGLIKFFVSQKTLMTTINQLGCDHQTLSQVKSECRV